MFHPSACLLVWVFFAVAVQFYGWVALLIAGVLLLSLGRGIASRWMRQVRRAKWLFLTLWLILAYGVPGELWGGHAWAPTSEGMELASLHAARLLVLFGSIAALFESLPQRRFIAGLWELARPFGAFGWRADQSVARLALVFDYLEKAPPRGTWRHFLEWPAEHGARATTVVIEQSAWRRRDILMLVLASVTLPAAAWIS